MDRLTKRRRQVATLACRGFSNRQIAEKLSDRRHRQDSSARDLRETTHSFHGRANDRFGGSRQVFYVLVVFATDIGGLGLLGWHSKRKAERSSLFDLTTPVLLQCLPQSAAA